MTTRDLDQLKAAFEEVSGMPNGPERAAGLLALLAEAEQHEDHSFRCQVLIWISDEYMDTGNGPGMVEYFDKAWAVYQEHTDEIDPYVVYNLRTTFSPTINMLDRDPNVPGEEVLARLEALEEFYREHGFSLRIPYRTRHWFHRRRGEIEQASEYAERLVAAPGDGGARCDAMGPKLVAQWYQGGGDDLARAAELWRMITQLKDIRCEEDHRSEAYAELVSLSLRLGNIREARRAHRVGYPLIRRRPDEWRALDLHMMYAARAQDVARFLRIVHDHVELLDMPLDGDVFWFQGRVLQFLALLCRRGQSLMPVTLADGGEVTAQELRSRLDASLAGYAAENVDLAEQLRHFREDDLEKVQVPPEDEDDRFWETVLPPVPAPWAAPPDLEDLPRGWTAQDAALAEARVLDYIGHPHSKGAWARVAALGTPRTPVDQGRLSAYRSGQLMSEGDYANARTLALANAEFRARNGLANDALESRMIAALAAYQAKDEQTALAERDAVIAEAGAGRAAGTVSDETLIELLGSDFMFNAIIELKAYSADVNDARDNSETSAKFSAATALFHEKGTAHAELAALCGWWAFYRENLTALFSRYGVQPDFVRETSDRLDFWYKVAGRAYRDAMRPVQQAGAELKRGRNLLASGRFAEAEEAALEAVRLSAGLDAEDAGKIRLLQAEAVARQDDSGARDEELLKAAREAALLLAGEDEHGAAFARVLLADVHRRAEKYEEALAVYASAVRVLDDEWTSLSARPYLARATAGRVVCLRRLDRADEAKEILDGLRAELSETNQIALAMTLHEIGHAFQVLGDPQAALEDLASAITMEANSAQLEPRLTALIHAAETIVPQDPGAAMSLLNEAVKWIGAKIEQEKASIDEQHARSAERARERGEQPEAKPPVQPSRALLARQAELKTRRIRLLVEPHPVSEEQMTELLPAAYESAVEGVTALGELVRTADAEDTRRYRIAKSLERGVAQVAVAQSMGLGDVPGATQRYRDLAALAEECGFKRMAEKAARNAEAMAAGKFSPGDQGAQPQAAAA